MTNNKLNVSVQNNTSLGDLYEHIRSLVDSYGTNQVISIFLTNSSMSTDQGELTIEKNKSNEGE